MSTDIPSARRLEGKVAIITGAASGLGEACARLFVAHGAKVIIADIQDDLGTNLAANLGSAATYVHCDVCDENQVSEAVNLAVSKHGGLDIMVNNAGIGSKGESITELDMEAWDRVMKVNVRGVVLGVKHAARAMVKARKGSIICTASVAGVVASGRSHGYSISKHAVLGVVKMAAFELGKYGIRVNAISPFAVATPMVLHAYEERLARPLTYDEVTRAILQESDLHGVPFQPEDVAHAALYLASNDSRFVNGHNLVLDGGFSISRPFTPRL